MILGIGHFTPFIQIRLVQEIPIGESIDLF